MHRLRTGPDFFSPGPRPLVYFVGATIVFARPVRAGRKKVTMTNRNRDTTFEDCWYWEEGYLYKIDYLNFLLFLLLYYSKREKSFFSIYIVWFQRLFSIFFIFDIVIFCNVFQFFLLLNSACYVAIYRLRNYWSFFSYKA